MGTLRGDNGGGERPQEGGGLPDLPPEWGTVIIPDDPGALDDEGTSIRRQFRRAAIRRRWRRVLHLQPQPLRLADDDSPGLAVPLLIMSIAVIATLVSLFAVAWPGTRPRTTPQVPRSSPDAAVSLGRLSVYDTNGDPMPMSSLTPAVVLLVEGCSCEQLITGTVEAVAASGHPTITVLVVGVRVPTLPTGVTQGRQGRIVAYADPNSSLRAAVPAISADRTTAAVLIGADGRVVRTVRSVTAAADFAADLPRLAVRSPTATA